ncbi:isochorismatase family cysteine hydrolase [Nocardia carnea]|uniref:isochorismatase family cysteine hydrolase n=1 Tax=Nocardia carnea TaxID=37328 RepID=UPI0024549908|nr:isochorismatase family cysteine hydrolase [Nocardia carnea]
MTPSTQTGAPLLVVIDVQNGFIVPASAPAVPAAARLVHAWTAAPAPVVLTRYYNHADSPFAQVLDWHAMTEAPDTDLVADLLLYLGKPGVHVVDKDTYSALTPEVTRILAATATTDVYLCGIATDACVLATAIAMFDAGFTPWIIRDACASNASRLPPEQLHITALTLLERFLGSRHLIDSAQALSAVSAYTGKPKSQP